MNDLSFYLNQKVWKHESIPIEISKKKCDKIFDLFFYRKLYVLIKNYIGFLGKHESKFVCRRCLNCILSKNVLLKHKQRCELQEITSIKIPKESHTYWKKHFYLNPITFRQNADFEADNEFGNSDKGNKTTNPYKHNPVCNGCYIESELHIV